MQIIIIASCYAGARTPFRAFAIKSLTATPLLISTHTIVPHKFMIVIRVEPN